MKQRPDDRAFQTWEGSSLKDVRGVILGRKICKLLRTKRRRLNTVHKSLMKWTYMN